jgi:D-sedoheptulose 7-phosphate isomerase
LAVRPADRLRKNLQASIDAKRALLDDPKRLATFAAAVDMVTGVYQAGGRLYIAGNGGSAADAQHLAAEFVSRLAKERRALPAEALTVDSSILTAVANDYGYEQVFARQLAAKASTRDAFLAITTSGNSPNILRALEECRRLGVRSLLFTGRDGGAARALADHSITAPGTATSAIQEVHIVLAHTLCECVEEELTGFTN